jgi:uncharacterized membrane protein SpoIIM required for sporulation
MYKSAQTGSISLLLQKESSTMDSLLMSNLGVALFWVLVVHQVLWAGFVFQGFYREYDNDVERFGEAQTRRDLWIVGLLCTFVPVLQVTLWLTGVVTGAWIILILVILFWVASYFSHLPKRP